MLTHQVSIRSNTIILGFVALVNGGHLSAVGIDEALVPGFGKGVKFVHAVVIEGIDNDINFITAGVLLIKVATAILIGYAFFAKFAFGNSELAVNISICGREQIRSGSIYTLSEDIEDLRIEFDLHMFLHQSIIFPFNLQILYMLVNPVYNSGNNIFRFGRIQT